MMWQKSSDGVGFVGVAVLVSLALGLCGGWAVYELGRMYGHF